MHDSNLKWVGHRGWPEQYPENSLAGARAALACGADGVEVDVQFTVDGEPVLLHDKDVTRVSHDQQNITQLSSEQLSFVSVHEPDRFGEKYFPTPIAHLNELLMILDEYPDQKLFLEIKSEIFDSFQRLETLQILARYLAGFESQLVLISFDLYVLRLAQEHFGWQVGWVLTQYNHRSLARIKLKPVDVVICNIRKIPAESTQLWHGPWQWFMYDIITAEDTALCQRYGVTWLESWDVGKMMATQFEGLPSE